MEEERERHLGNMTWEEVSAAVRAGRTGLILPLGATEQHGPHLPLETDNLIASAVATKVAAMLPYTLVGPTIPIGCSDEHRGFSGLLGFEAETLANLILDIAQRAAGWGVSHLIVISGHGGNGQALTLAQHKIDRGEAAIPIWLPTDVANLSDTLTPIAAEDGLSRAEVGLHAGEGETSQIEYLAPDQVRSAKKRAGFMGEYAPIWAVMRRQGLRPVTESGVLGDPTRSSATRGAAYVAAQAAQIVTEVCHHWGWRPDSRPVQDRLGWLKRLQIVSAAGEDDLSDGPFDEIMLETAETVDIARLWSALGVGGQLIGDETQLASIPDDGWMAAHDRGRVTWRKGRAPRYKLADTATIREDHTVALSQPTRVVRFNQGAADLLRLLAEAKEGLTLADLQRGAGSMSPKGVQRFVEQCIGRRIITPIRSPDYPMPPISIVVPAHNRHTQTRACVEALLATDYPSEKREIILVDDGSDPPLAEALSGLPLTVLRPDKNLGPSGARNFGIAHATGEWVLFTDNDCIVDSGWIRKMLPHFNRPEVIAVGGRVLAPAEDQNLLVRYDGAESPLDMGGAPGQIGPRALIPYAPSANLAMHRTILDQIDGFQADMFIGEDVDLIWRGLRLGGRAEYEPEAKIVHHHRDQLWPFLRRRADYAYSEVDLRERHLNWKQIIFVPWLPLVSAFVLPAFFLRWWLILPSSAILIYLISIKRAGKKRRTAEKGMGLTNQEIDQALWGEFKHNMIDFGGVVGRYLSLPLLLGSLLWLPLALIPAYFLVGSTFFRYKRKRPNLPFLSYLTIYILEMLAYQIGLYWGCWEKKSLKVFRPNLTWEKRPERGVHNPK